MRLLEPTREHAIFRHPIENAIGAHNGGVLRPRQNQNPHQHHEGVEEQLKALRPGQIHRDATDQVGKVIRTDLVRNNHHCEERDQRGKQQAVNKNYQPGLLEVLELGMLDFTIDLRQSFFAAHRQYGMPEPHEQNDPGNVPEPGSIQPSQRFLVQRNHPGMKRIRRQHNGGAQNRNGAPDQQNHHHHRGDHHDL